MKIVIPGGTGQIGVSLRRHFEAQGHRVVTLSRTGGDVRWDGKSLGDWVSEIDGADVVINLAGRTVNCRYNEANLRQMMDSRVDSTRVIGEAIAQAQRPPKVWLQSSTATIYSHSYDAPNDEFTGILGGNEPNLQPKWLQSTQVAKEWEATLNAAETPKTRRVALRSAMTMSPETGGIFDVLAGLTRRGLGGPIAGGRQYVSWIHHRDFCRAIDWILAKEDLVGPINLASPNPLPQREFQAILRRNLGVKLGLPTTRWMAEIGALVMGTETELIFKSRRVVPGILLQSGFEFSFPDWDDACADLLLDE